MAKIELPDYIPGYVKIKDLVKTWREDVPPFLLHSNFNYIYISLPDIGDLYAVGRKISLSSIFDDVINEGSPEDVLALAEVLERHAGRLRRHANRAMKSDANTTNRR